MTLDIEKIMKLKGEELEEFAENHPHILLANNPERFPVKILVQCATAAPLEGLMYAAHALPRYMVDELSRTFPITALSRSAQYISYEVLKELAEKNLSSAAKNPEAVRRLPEELHRKIVETYPYIAWEVLKEVISEDLWKKAEEKVSQNEKRCMAD